jgi:hypothetical protein
MFSAGRFNRLTTAPVADCKTLIHGHLLKQSQPVPGASIMCSEFPPFRLAQLSPLAVDIQELVTLRFF